MRLGIGSGDTFAINRAGEIAGTSNTNGQLQVQFGNVFRAGLHIDGHWIELGGIPGCDESRAYGLNDADQAVGSCNTPYRGDYHAILWDQGKAIDLGTLGGPIGWGLLGRERAVFLLRPLE